MNERKVSTRAAVEGRIKACANHRFSLRKYWTVSFGLPGVVAEFTIFSVADHSS